MKCSVNFNSENSKVVLPGVTSATLRDVLAAADIDANSVTAVVGDRDATLDTLVKDGDLVEVTQKQGKVGR